MEVMGISVRGSQRLQEAKPSPSTQQFYPPVANVTKIVPPMPTKILNLNSIPKQIPSIEEAQDFNSDYYKSQKYMNTGRQSSFEEEGTSQDGDGGEAMEEGEGLKELLWPPQLLNAANKYGHFK